MFLTLNTIITISYITYNGAGKKVLRNKRRKCNLKLYNSLMDVLLIIKLHLI